MHTPIRGLRSFCVAARTLSFKKAAEQLYLTPSAVSHQIKQLEMQLGLSLFHRQTRSIALTPAGKNFYEAVAPLIEDLSNMINQFSQQQQNQQISIALPEFFASELLMPKLSQWTQAHPEINLQVNTVRTRSENASHTDLSVVLSQHQPTEGIARALFALSYLPVANRELLKTWQRDNYQCLNQVPLILHRARPWAWHQWAEKVGIDDFAPSQILQIDSMFGVARAAQQGMGIALIPLPISQSWLDDGGLHMMFSQQLPTRDKYYLVQHEATVANSALKSFAEWIVKTFSHMS
ncbi:HTH-type transcriptional activator AmpR [Saliniradius amylolyticus]|uniref:HTH-type transcriptional activator AmpR n=1 Tax=Saliniradius amylolyticus TaxID=2183582 RepID=A0A2S2E3U9_9ALTE|nr:LysR substrate-binding domain-containing protein [Saliniradius amylolyticus]AWL12313.1 HTH-type transcriptional activator AmpR [Saliniradius amylolyticus]